MTKNLETKLLDYAMSEAVGDAADGRDEKIDLFVRGGRKAMELLWHDAGEQPEPGREIIVRNAKGIKIYPNPSNSNTSWLFFTRISRAVTWAYSEDIIPPESKG